MSHLQRIFSIWMLRLIWKYIYTMWSCVGSGSIHANEIHFSRQWNDHAQSDCASRVRDSIINKRDSNIKIMKMSL